MIQYHPSYPMRPVDWRWERARIIRETQKKISRKSKEDDFTVLALRFQKKLFKCKNDYDRFDLIDKHPDIYFAYAIHNEDDKKITIRSEIEARILANETSEKIADRCGCSIETIDLYEKLFFNVREKLKNTTYILHQVMGPAIHKGMYERDHDLLWKLYGYFCGSAVLDALTTTFTNPVKPETPEQVDALFVDDTRAVMRRKAAIAARTVSVNDQTQLRILEIYAQFLEIEKEAEGGASGESLIMNNIETMMLALPWATGSNAAGVNNRLIQHYDNQAAELRADETVAVGAGLESQEHLDLVNITFPEAPNHDR